MRTAGTNLKPRRPVVALVTSGPFRFTRNPLYLSLVLLSIGTAPFFDIAWLVFALVPTAFVVQRYVNRRKERYLEAKFGAAHLEYRKIVVGYLWGFTIIKSSVCFCQAFPCAHKMWRIRQDLNLQPSDPKLT